MRVIIAKWISLLLLFSISTVAKGQLTFTTNYGTITITGFTVSPTNLDIPSTTNGYPVTGIGGSAFMFCYTLTNVTIPDSVTSIGDDAFWSCGNLTSVTIGANVVTIGNMAFSSTGVSGVTIPSGVVSINGYAFSYCTNLRRIYFRGNAPSFDYDPFLSDSNVTVYYLPETTGWGSTFGSGSTVLWNPTVQTSNNFGVLNGEFGFYITGSSNDFIEVEASTNLNNPVWVLLQSRRLSGVPYYFSDSQWMYYPRRFYRIGSR